MIEKDKQVKCFAFFFFQKEERYFSDPYVVVW